MGQDAWNLMFGSRINPKTRKGTQVDMHSDEGYGGQMVPGYAGAYKNSKTRVLGAKKRKPMKGYTSASDSFLTPQPFPKKRK